ncbi:MAG TPA: hypothetical protein VII28_07765 [Puia sp.]
MMPRFQTALVACLAMVNLHSFAQSVKLQWTERDKPRSKYISMVKDGKNGFVRIGYISESPAHHPEKVDKLLLEHYSQGLGMVSSKEVALPVQALTDPKIINLKGHYFLLSVKDGKKISVFLTPLDLEKDQAGPAKEILHSDAESKWNLDHPKIYYPADSGPVLIALEYVISKKGNQQFADVLIDPVGNKIWDKYFDIPVMGEIPNMYALDDRYAFRQAVSNAGDAYTVYQKENSSDAVMVHIDKTGNKTEHPLQLAVSRIIDAAIIINAKQQLYYGGLYQNANEILEGQFFVSLDPSTGAAAALQTKTFDPELLKKLYEENYIKGSLNPAGLADLYLIKSVAFTANGSLYFSAEYTRFVDRSVSSPRMEMEYGDILVLEYLLGDRLQALRIPKYQASINDIDHNSFFALPVENKMAFFYDDCASNLTSGDQLVRCSIYGQVRDLVLVMATIDENNKLSRKSIFNIEEMDLIPFREYFTKISGNQISLFAKMYHALRKPDVAVGVISFR